ncbi:pituitary tumor-transforming gene 1 protein-interacting protein-like isoform X2 [Chroicocephalus ridibundus]|uniref:pituitary tumor-transforming gene 1 protein-interacting protein-like isoform X2 n=1 Tax=Chroicocephalus ridibundus TaxID=1192867 RepID=UPI002FDE0125
MAAVRLWQLWLQGLALVWGRAGMGLAHLAATAPPPQACSEFSQRSCEECLKNVSCLWCYTNNTCVDYPVRSILPPSSLCSLSNARWGVCWSRPDEEEERLARKREERRLQSLQRKHERKMKHDEIRKKYGLLQDSDNPYSRFENE